MIEARGVGRSTAHAPVTAFEGRRLAELDGKTDSIGRVVDFATVSPHSPLLGAVTVMRNCARHS